jgi:hypothetical protein
MTIAEQLRTIKHALSVEQMAQLLQLEEEATLRQKAIADPRYCPTSCSRRAVPTAS